MTALDEPHLSQPAPSGADAENTARRLHAERDFLLRSIADLDAEHAAGELADARHRELRNDYTVQAATVLRAIDRLEAQEASGEPPPGRNRRRPLLAAAAVLVVAVVGTGLLVRSLGDRQPGQTITGNAQSTAPDLDGLARAALDRPDDPAVQLQYAQALLQADRPVDALRAFDAAARLDPDDPAPKAYGGWIVFLAGLPDEALPRLDAAIAADPAYPDAHFFRGMVLLRGRDDTAGALVELQEFVRLAPPGDPRDKVRSLIAELEQPATTTTVP